MRLITTEAQRHGEIEDGKDPTTSPTIGAAIEIHPNLGAGFLESAYEECLGHELHLRGLDFKRQMALPLLYKGLK
jgi:GxxExxY protein